MEATDIKTSRESTKKYLALIALIEGIENRLKWSEIVFISMNLVVIFSIMGFLSANSGQAWSPLLILFLLFSHAAGISINAYWTASSTRSQLKLKLRYFQARFLERKLNCEGEYIISDESLFFNPSIRKVKSPDGKETVLYPTEGILRMDGFVGAAKPRTLSLMMPLLFFIIYLSSLLTIFFMVF